MPAAQFADQLRRVEVAARLAGRKENMHARPFVQGFREKPAGRTGRCFVADCYAHEEYGEWRGWVKCEMGYSPREFGADVAMVYASQR